jgi:coenzyme PQQ precursor peptide PqqA
MQWTTPDFVEIPLGMEVTNYANTDEPPAREPRPASSDS